MDTGLVVPIHILLSEASLVTHMRLVVLAPDPMLVAKSIFGGVVSEEVLLEVVKLKMLEVAEFDPESVALIK